MSKAIYAGSFDPITNGHLWVIKRAAEIFENLIVAVGNHPDKNYTFSVAERIALLQSCTAEFSNIRVGEFSGEFLVNYAIGQHAKYIVRGIRNVNDYEFERTIRYINSDVCDEVNTIFLIPPRDYAEVSSSLVKGFVGSRGWQQIVSKYVPEIVVKALIDKNDKELHEKN